MPVDALASVPLLSSLSRKELESLAKGTTQRDYAPGDSVMRQGDTGVGLAIITSGKVRVVQTKDGQDRELGTFGPGSVLGELSLLDDLPRTASVIATEVSHAVLIPVWDFRAALKEHPEISIKLLAVLSQRLRKQEQGGAHE
ncbi:MAG TPA: cyclic nucleotide-binding domain-containing protein [Ktedonobacterales bacterium]